MNPQRAKFRSAGLSLVIGLALLCTAACGSSGGDSKSPRSGTKTGSAEAATSKPLKVVAGVVSDFMLPYIAQQKGLFAKEGVNVDVMPLPGAAQVQIPMVLNGQIDLGVASTGDLLPGITHGIKLQTIANVGSVAVGDVSKSTTDLIYKDPKITRPRDLEGKTVGLNSIGGTLQLTVSAVIKADGGDPKKVHYIQVPVQDMQSAIEKGQIAAGQGFEPFLSSSLKSGLKALFSTNQPVAGLPAAVYFATPKLLKARAKDVAAFVRAMNAAAQLVNDDPDVMRQVLKQQTKYPAALLDAEQNFGQFATAGSLPAATFEKFATFAADQGLISKAPPLQDWVYVPSS